MTFYETLTYFNDMVLDGYLTIKKDDQDQDLIHVSWRTPDSKSETIHWSVSESTPAEEWGRTCVWIKKWHDDTCVKWCHNEREEIKE